MQEFQGQQWVVRRYLASAVAIIKQTVEQHTKRVVKMHMLARNFAKNLEQELEQGGDLELNGPTLS